MLEKIGEFFDNRLEIYEEHQMNCIESAREFYKFTAECLPKDPDCSIIDLGCGTGLELDEFFVLNPSARVTGIDLAPGMLKKLQDKFYDKDVNLILGSYFDVPFGIDNFNAAVSVESLHHFTMDEKIPLYSKLWESLKLGGYYILTDYFASSNEEEVHCREELIRLKKEQGINNDEFYHYDTPLTVEHEMKCLKSAGFSSVEVLNEWGFTCTIKAIK